MDRRHQSATHLWSKLPGRFRRSLLVAGATTLIGWSAAWSQAPPPSRMPVGPAGTAVATAPTQPGKDRLREGTELHKSRGYFRFVDDRVVYFDSNGESRYTGLENLNLERIVAEITNNPTQLEWTVAGTVTEYRGTNYLLVRRAVLARSSAQFDVMPAQTQPEASRP